MRFSTREELINNALLEVKGLRVVYRIGSVQIC
jgi:hypothetical protein